MLSDEARRIAADIAKLRGLLRLADYKQDLVGAKPGDWVAVTYPGDKGKLNISIINKPGGGQSGRKIGTH